MKKFLINFKFFFYLYKIIKIFRNNKPSKHYGEFAEDVFINRILKDIKRGSYVDVGCYHPYKGSLTALLYNKNWNGINIDISKTSIDLFNLIRKRDINIHTAVSNFDGKTLYYENNLINQQNSLIKSNSNQKKIEVNCYTLNSIFEKFKISKFDYLNIDVEGNELNVINGIDLNKYKPTLITIENNDLIIEDYMESEIYKILIKNNYILINKIGVTNFFMYKKFANQISNLIKI